jgi:hypothetical protein
MKNKIKLILSVTFLFSLLTSIEASDKTKAKQAKKHKFNKHTSTCNCGVIPPKPPKFRFWYNWK